jgi:AcrR family transcriptional regulator
MWKIDMAARVSKRKSEAAGSAQAVAGRRSAGKSGVRESRSVERREAILAAALEEFAVNGFAGTRLDDIARRAKIAKGTIYLYFADKETLFQELLRAMFAPVVRALETLPATDMPTRDIMERMIGMFVQEVLATRRKDVIRLVIAEGPRFPKLAEIHYREVLSRIMAVMSALMARAIARGEVKNPAYAKFPQLIAAPGLVAVIWSGLFERFAPLDVGAMMRAHLDIVFGERKAP